MPRARTRERLFQYYVAHPNATCQDVMRDLGVSASTLSKFRRKVGMARSGGAKMAQSYLTDPSTLTPWEHELVADVAANITMGSRSIAMRHPYPDGSHPGRKTIDHIRQVLRSKIAPPPPKDLGVWRDIDWSRCNREIANETGRHLTSVARNRLELAPPHLRRGVRRVPSKPAKPPRPVKVNKPPEMKTERHPQRKTTAKKDPGVPAPTKGRPSSPRPESSRKTRVVMGKTPPKLTPSALPAPDLRPGGPVVVSVAARAPAPSAPVCAPVAPAAISSAPVAPAADGNNRDGIHPSDDMGWADPDGTRGAFVAAADQWMDVRRREGGSAAANGLFQTAYVAYTRLPPQAPPKTPPHSSSRRKGKGTPVLSANSHPPLADRKVGDEGDTDADTDLDLDVDHADIAT